MAKITTANNEFVIIVEFWENERAKAIPEREWDKENKCWVTPFTEVNAKYIKREFALSEITTTAQSKIDELFKAKEEIVKGYFPAWYEFKNPPRKHQLKALNKAWPLNEFAFFHEMRTGKTYTTINLACARAMEGKINGVIIFCPTPIKSVWDLQTEEHAPIPTQVHVLTSGDKKVDRFIDHNEDKGLKFLVVGIEALSQGGAFKIAQRFAAKHKCMVVIDESSRIKNHKSARTAKAQDIGGLGQYRTILTGTPITQGLQDLYAQYAFLNWKIIGMKSYYTFQNRYCVMGGFENRSVIGYLNVRELLDNVGPYSDVVKMSEVADLPPNIYQQRYIKPSPAQTKAFKDLQDVFTTEHEDGSVLETETVLERMTRYQQIAGGSFPYKLEDDEGYSVKPLAGKNPKMEELKELIPEIEGKIIIWARFRPEITSIVEFLTKQYGEDSVVQFHGGISHDERRNALIKFQSPFQEKGTNCRFFVSNQQTGGMGIKLSAARTAIYYSNDFSHENRVQSEARPHDVEMTDSVLYVDLILDHKVDKMIHTALAKKQSVATYVTNELKGEG